MTLSPLEPEDLELLYTIENEPALWDVSSTTVPYSRYALRNYIATQQSDIYADRQVRLAIRTGEEQGFESKSEGNTGGNDGKEGAKDARQAVGLIDLFNFEPKHLRAEMGIALLKEAQGKGYAVEAIRQLADYARDTLLLHQIYCIVPADNEASLTMLHRAGFTSETTLPDWLQTPDGWQDAILLRLVL